MKCHILFCRENKKTITNLSSAELAKRVVEVKQTILTLKALRKTASENVVCLCRLLNILANFSNLFLHTGKQCGPRSDSPRGAV